MRKTVTKEIVHILIGILILRYLPTTLVTNKRIKAMMIDLKSHFINFIYNPLCIMIFS